MRWSGFFLPGLVAALLAASPALTQDCEDGLDLALDGIDESSEWSSLGKLNDARGIAKAYLEAPEGKKAEAVAKAMAQTGVTMTFGLGAKLLIIAGKIYVNGAEWTVAQAERMQTDAYICGDSSMGSDLRYRSVFNWDGAQHISPRISCTNYPDFLDTPQKFKAFGDFFRGHYSRTVGETGMSQDLLDRQWAVIEATWRVREAERQMKRLEAEVLRRMEAAAKAAAGACKPKAAPPPVLGADTSDPAKLPEPPLPEKGMLVLTETVVTPHALDPSITHSAAPQRNSLSAYWGESTCVWSAPPKALVSEEVFGFDFSLSVGSKNQQRYSETILVRSGFANVGGTPNEITIGVEPGGGKSAQGHLELSAGNLEDAAISADYVSWYLTVAGCGGNVDYIYKFRKP